MQRTDEGSNIVGRIAGVSFAWHIDIDQSFVRKDGVDVEEGIPTGRREELAAEVMASQSVLRKKGIPFMA